MSVRHFTDWRDFYSLDVFCEVDFWINCRSLESIRKGVISELAERRISVQESGIIDTAIEMRIDELNRLHDLPWAVDSLKADYSRLGYPVTEPDHLDWCFCQEWYRNFFTEMLKTRSLDETVDGLASGEITFDAAHGNLCGFSTCEIKAALVRNIVGEEQ